MLENLSFVIEIFSVYRLPIRLGPMPDAHSVIEPFFIQNYITVWLGKGRQY